MPSEFLVKNNARTTLLAGITNVATSLSAQAGHGARFDNPTGVQYCRGTIYNAAGLYEVVGFTRSGDVFTITRALEGTTALAWNALDGFEQRLTAPETLKFSQLDRTETYTAPKTFTEVADFLKGLGSNHTANLGIEGTVAANALTLAITTQAGATPTATDKAVIALRHGTLTTGQNVLRAAVAATTVVLPDGGTGGFTNPAATVTMTIASPALVTHNNHQQADGAEVIFTTTGALPTGLTAGTTYYVKTPLTNSYNVAATPGGVAINTSGSQSGVHTATVGDIGYFHLYAIDFGGVIEAAIIKDATLDEGVLHSTTAIGTGSDSSNVLYSTTARTNVPIKLIGRIRIRVGATPGKWYAAPTEKAAWAPAMDKTGDTIEYISATGFVNPGQLAIATFTNPVNVDVGDLLTVSCTTNGIRDGADFAYQLNVGTSGGGTSVFTYDGNLSVAGLIFLGPAVYITRACGTFTFRCTKAGTLVSAGIVASGLVGTAALVLSSYVSAEIQRRQR